MSRALTTHMNTYVCVFHIFHQSRCLCDSKKNSVFFFFNDTATPEIYTLSLHDALPISPSSGSTSIPRTSRRRSASSPVRARRSPPGRSEEHTSELQSHEHLVCRLL